MQSPDEGIPALMQAQLVHAAVAGLALPQGGQRWLLWPLDPCQPHHLLAEQQTGAGLSAEAAQEPQMPDWPPAVAWPRLVF